MRGAGSEGKGKKLLSQAASVASPIYPDAVIDVENGIRGMFGAQHFLAPLMSRFKQSDVNSFFEVGFCARQRHSLFNPCPGSLSEG